jgi:hypothetical protein
MSYTFLLESGEESSAECFSDIDPSVRSSLTHTLGESSWVANETASYQGSPFSEISENLTGDLGGTSFNWFAGGFPVLTSPKQSGERKESTARQADSGPRWRELFLKFDPVESSLKTHLCLWDEVLDESSVTLPDWGMMRGGEFWEQDTPVLVMDGTDFGSWATPTSRDWKDTRGMTAERSDGKTRVDQLPRQVYACLDGSELFVPPTAKETWMEVNSSSVPSAAGTTGIADALDLQWTMNSTTRSETGSNMPDQETLGQLNVEFPEWLNGLPIGWTDLSPLETAKFQVWLNLHGRCLEGTN